MAKSKVAPAPKLGTATKAAQATDWKSKHEHLFPADKRNYGVGRATQPTKEMSRMVKWPRYVRIQRQRAVIRERIRIPPSINQFTNTLDKNQASNVFKLLAAYKPESKQEKKQRLLSTAGAAAKDANVQDGKKPMFVKYGLQHVTTLVEKRLAKLVVIAHDVDPIELVVWLPALCRKKDIPYCIVKGKARLGTVVYKKTAAVCAITDVKKEDQAKLQQIIASVATVYGGRKLTWGANVVGMKSRHVAKAKADIIAREANKKIRMV